MSYFSGGLESSHPVDQGAPSGAYQVPPNLPQAPPSVPEAPPKLPEATPKLSEATPLLSQAPPPHATNDSRPSVTDSDLDFELYDIFGYTGRGNLNTPSRGLLIAPHFVVLGLGPTATRISASTFWPVNSRIHGSVDSGVA